MQILGELGIAHQIGEDPQRSTHQHRGHDGQSVEAVGEGEIDGVAAADNDKVRQHDVEKAQIQSHILEKGHDQLGLRRTLGGHIEKDRGSQPSGGLPEVFPSRRQSPGVLLHHLAVVVHPAHGTEQKGHRQHNPDIAVGEIRPQQRRQQNGHEDQGPAHGGCTGLAEMGLGPVVAHRLPDLQTVESPDHGRPQQQR